MKSKSEISSKSEVIRRITVYFSLLARLLYPHDPLAPSLRLSLARLELRSHRTAGYPPLGAGTISLPHPLNGDLRRTD